MLLTLDYAVCGEKNCALGDFWESDESVADWLWKKFSYDWRKFYLRGRVSGRRGCFWDIHFSEDRLFVEAGTICSFGFYRERIFSYPFTPSLYHITPAEFLRELDEIKRRAYPELVRCSNGFWRNLDAKNQRIEVRGRVIQL